MANPLKHDAKAAAFKLALQYLYTAQVSRAAEAAKAGKAGR